MQKQYDAQGNLISRTESSADRLVQGAGQAAGIAALAIITVVVAPFLPILWAGYQAFQFLIMPGEWHELFAGIVALALVGCSFWLLWNFKWIRLPYFGAEVLFASWFSFQTISETSDTIWGGTSALVVFALGVWIVILIEKWFAKRA